MSYFIFFSNVSSLFEYKEKSQSAVNNINQNLGIILSLTFVAANVTIDVWVIVTIVIATLVLALVIVWFIRCWNSSRRRRCTSKNLEEHNQ